jgi:hypothetical protein
MPDSTEDPNGITYAALLYGTGPPPFNVEQGTPFDVDLTFHFKGSIFNSSEEALPFASLEISLDEYRFESDGSFDCEEVDSDPPSSDTAMPSPRILQCGLLMKTSMAPFPDWKDLMFQIPVCIETPGIYKLHFYACLGVQSPCIIATLAKTIVVAESTPGQANSDYAG